MKILTLINRNGTVSAENTGNRWAIRNYEGYNIPALYLEGKVGAMSKDVSVTMNYIYKELSGTCTVKWQGASSVDFPKKNYTIKFDQEFEVVSGWGAQKKYCFKANFSDPSHARNLVCAKLWGQMVKSRTTANATLNALPNGGAVDGFPVIISLNGEFHGLYTWNIPKDDWMFGMDGTGQQAIVCAEWDNNHAVLFKSLATFETDENGKVDFELEYSSDDESGWVLTALNKLISGVMACTDGSNIASDITPYIDWDSAIDYYIHTVLTTGYDGVHRNYLLSTYDGVKWFFTGYDMDTTFGAASLGKYFIDADHAPTFKSLASDHALFGIIWTYMRPTLRSRYNALRESVMSEINLATEFYNFASKIPLPIAVDDIARWKRNPSSLSSCTEQILNQYRLRVQLADQWITNTSGETEIPDAPVEAYTNLVTTAIGTDGNLYNGTGYKENYRLSSSGSESSAAGACVTGFIPFTYGAVIRMVGATGEVTNSGMYLGFYDDTFNVVKVEYLNALATGTTGSYTQRRDGTYEATFDTSALISGTLYNYMIDSSYIRVSLNPCVGENMIVTFDQEIPDE